MEREMDQKEAQDMLYKKRPWTTKEQKHLVRWYGDKAAKVIAQELGRTPSAINAMAHTLGLESQNGKSVRRKYDRLQLRTLIEQGLSSTEIATIMGAGPRHVRWMVVNDLGPQHIAALTRNGKRAQRTKNNVRKCDGSTRE